MGLEGEKSYQEICAVLGRSLESIRKWFDAYRKGGVVGLLTKARGQTGPKSRLSVEAKGDLLTGLKEGRWRSAAEIRAWLKEAHGIEVALSSVYKYLGKVQARLRVLRAVNIKKDSVAAEAFKSSSADKLEALEIIGGGRLGVTAVGNG
jgi:transposase